MPKDTRPMSDTLLPYYDRELTAIQRLATEFAEAHPKIAGRLRLSPGGWTIRMSHGCWKAWPSSPPACTTGWTTNSPS